MSWFLFYAARMKTRAMALSHDFIDLVDVIPSLIFCGVCPVVDIYSKAFTSSLLTVVRQSYPLHTFSNLYV